mmetsp:Transcript_7290/g.8737  ORF Transcript_7290/g.8737 Transcript_7290/m.8737 type:complete len:106 (+) Transcript_7290:1326-1643(+)
MPMTIYGLLRDISTTLRDIQSDASLLRKQDGVVGVVRQIELLGDTLQKDNKTRKNPRDENAKVLEEAEGISWSPLVFEELERRLDDARVEMINVAQQNSQWRSII